MSGGGNSVRAIAVQPNGKLIIGGSFTTLTPNGTPVTRNNIARLNADGTPDSFDPNTSGGPAALSLQSPCRWTGKILIGGAFDSLAPNSGATVGTSQIVRLNTDGTLDTTFSAPSTVTVRAIVIQPDGKILFAANYSPPSEYERHG